MDFRILGPLEVWDERGQLELRGARQRALLALLLLNRNRAVSSDRLIEELWPEAPPRNAANALQAAVSRVRRAIGARRVRAQAPGYVIALEPEELDLDRFEQLAAAGRAALAAGDAAAAAEALAEALSQWRGPPLAEFAYEPFAAPEIARLEELRLAALEHRIDADLALGRHRQVVGELESLVAEHPLRERLRASLMVALYRSGRQAEALASYQEARRAGVEELGIEPGPELKRIEAAILRQDPSLDPAPAPVPAAPRRPAPGVTVPADGRHGRKLLTVIFADIVESTSLVAAHDPERLRLVLERFFDTLAGVLERHGGRVDKFIGDAVMGVFGLPVVREDDAIRALRAAVEMRERVSELGAELEQELGARLAVRIGVETGEAFVGGGRDGQPLITGMVVNLAKRLEQAAPPGEALVGEGTHGLARHAATLEPVEPVAAKGVPRPLRAWRVLAVSPDAPAVPRSAAVPLVGRAPELDRLRAAFARCAAGRSSGLATVLGPPGIGKSRLVRELEQAVGDDALVLRGRCLPYGEGITYWALAEVVLQLAPGGTREELEALLPGDELAGVVADRVLAAVGAGGEPGPSEETHWAVRRLVEAVASDRPLVVVLDDVHWATPTFLDLVEYLAGFSAGPLLLVCIAREELLELRPSWPAGQPGRELVRLGPLSGSEPRELVRTLARGRPAIPNATVARILDVAEGNPLFLEQLVAAQLEAGGAAEPAVPPTVQALLAARIDRLEHDERCALERASVQGRVFHRRPLVDATPPDERATLGASLLSLIRKELLEPARADVPDDDAFRFRHLLLRDAAYAALPKESRAELHRRFADWVESSGVLLLERDEIAGHHLEQAHRYAAEIGLGTDDERRELARRGAERLEAAADRAARRIDLPAAANLYERAAAILPADDPARGRLLLGLGAALAEQGSLDEAASAFDAALAAADERTGAHVEVHRLLLRVQTEPERALAELEPVRARTAPLFERSRDRLGLCKLGQLEGRVRWLRGHAVAAEEAWRGAAAHARGAGSERDYTDILAWLASAALWGPTAVDDAIVRCEEIRAEVGADPYAEADVLRALAGLHAMAGRGELADELLAESRRLLEDRGRTVYSEISHHEALVAMLAGRPEVAEADLRAGVARLQDMGERSFLATTAALLARALVQQGRHGEALDPVRLAEGGAAADDLSSQVLWRSVKACALADRGEVAEAERLSREAVAIADRTDWLNERADAWLERAQVLQAAGRAGEAADAARTARDLYEQKGNVVGAGRAVANANGA